VSALQTQARHDEALRRWLDTLKRLPAETTVNNTGQAAAELEKEDYKTLSHMRQSFVNIL
jgi:hypothetical protein